MQRRPLQTDKISYQESLTSQSFNCIFETRQNHRGVGVGCVCVGGAVICLLFVALRPAKDETTVITHSEASLPLLLPLSTDPLLVSSLSTTPLLHTHKHTKAKTHNVIVGRCVCVCVTAAV